MRRLTFSLALVLLVGRYVAAQSQSSSNLWAGTRHLVASKSTFRGESAPKARTFTIEPVDGGIKATVSGTEADDTPVNFSYTAKFDGKAYPITGVSGDSMSFRRVTARKLEATRTTNGKVTSTSRYLLSKDGSVLTLTFVLPGGERGNVLVFKK